MKALFKAILFCLLNTNCFSTSPADAQQNRGTPRIGYLTTPTFSNTARYAEAFRGGLKQLGYVEGKNIIVELRSAEGKSERLPALAADLVRLNVNAIVTHSTPAIRAVKDATKTIPIIMANVGDPVAEGFVASLAHPGGNITGFTNLSPDLGTKRLEIIKEISPKIIRTAVFINPAQHASAVKDMEKAARSLRIQLIHLDVRSPEDLEPALEATVRERADALVTLPNPLLRLDSGARIRITNFTLKHRMASIYESEEYVDAGGLASYGPDAAANFRRAAIYVDKILNGAKPADLPVEQPTKFELVINLKTGKEIGLAIPPNVLTRADRVIK